MADSDVQRNHNNKKIVAGHLVEVGHRIVMLEKNQIRDVCQGCMYR